MKTDNKTIKVAIANSLKEMRKGIEQLKDTIHQIKNYAYQIIQRFWHFMCRSWRYFRKLKYDCSKWSSHDRAMFWVTLLSLICAVVTVVIAIIALKKIDYFSETAKISLIADPCLDYQLEGGNYDSCMDLEKLLEQKEYKNDQIIKNFIKRRIKRRDLIYGNVESIVAGIPVFRNEEGRFVQETFENLNLGNVYDHLDHFYWGSRAKAAFLVQGINNQLIKDFKEKTARSILWKDILNRLVDLIIKDGEALVVRKTALEVFAKIIKYEQRTIFDFQGAGKYWQEKQIDILNKLEKGN